MKDAVRTLILFLLLLSPLLMAGGGEDFPMQAQRAIRHSGGGGLNWSIIIPSVLGFLGTVFTGYFGYKKVKAKKDKE